MVNQHANTTLINELPDDSGTPIFHGAVLLDGRTSVVRTGETNISNMLTDAVRAYNNADIASGANSGNLRCDWQDHRCWRHRCERYDRCINSSVPIAHTEKYVAVRWPRASTLTPPQIYTYYSTTRP